MQKLSLFIFTLLFSVTTIAATPEVGQKNKRFSVKEITVKQGGSVKFVNNDPFFHNVFSLSDTKLFDLGSFPQGESKEVVFDVPGKVEVECAIHPHMRMTVIVK